MRAGTDADMRDREPARAATVRISSRRAMIGPAVTALYLAATRGAPHRPVMACVVAAMLTVAALTWWSAPVLARSRARVAVQCAGMLVNIAASSVLTLLDGGVAGPLGALVPFTLLFYAIMMPPRMYVVAAVLSAAGYWTVAIVGDPAPDGYAVVYTLGIGGVAYLCLRHAAALAALRRRLAEASRTDPLTRCLNRRGFDERLERAVATAAVTGTPVTLVVADLDRFKLINDTWGHAAGDDVLAGVAATMAATLRDGDVVGRLGGDEFGALLPGAGPEEAEALVRRLRAALDEGAPVSLGHAALPAQAPTADTLRALADQRAYADKVSRPGREPCREDVERVRARAGAGSTRRITGTERRRRSIADMGRLAACDCAVGLVYVAGFAGDSSSRFLMGLLCAAGLLYGAGLIALAGRLSRWHRTRQAMAASAVLLFSLAIAVPVLDGGVGSATGVALLAPMPLIALGAPLRGALPVLAAEILAYLAVAAVPGGPGGWYVVMHLIGVLTVSAACAAQGRAAAQRRRRLTELSRTDVLTGLLNRRGFDERYAAARDEARRNGRAVALMLVDLDGFKTLNDTYGHAAGDELLRRVAGALRAAAGPDDVVARLGGDEFAVLLTGRSPEALTDAAARVRAALAEQAAASTGTATLHTGGDDFAAVYARADAQLYARKAARGPCRRPVPRAAVPAL